MAFYQHPDLFANPCAKAGRCPRGSAEHQCEHAVVRDASGIGGWFITFGHAGYNLPTNNRFGYRSESAARAAIRRLIERAEAVR